MSSNEPTVELMGTRTGESGDFLAEVYDRESGTYFFPQTPDMRFKPLDFVRAVKEEAISIAFLDSGMLSEHPAIRPRLRHSVDFTAEGTEDFNGHGTLVTLLGLAAGSPETALINVKVLNRSGSGKMSWLAKGLEWCTENAKLYNIRVVNLSAGIYHKKWGFLECRSDCSVCNAARNLYKSGIMLCVASGNDGPDNLPCPQRVGLLEDTFLVVPAFDPLSGNITDYSGRGNMAAPEARIRKIPLG
jgi:subtilisin family serine protease